MIRWRCHSSILHCGFHRLLFLALFANLRDPGLILVMVLGILSSVGLLLNSFYMLGPRKGTILQEGIEFQEKKKKTCNVLSICHLDRLSALYMGSAFLKATLKAFYKHFWVGIPFAIVCFPVTTPCRAMSVLWSSVYTRHTSPWLQPALSAL